MGHRKLLAHGVHRQGYFSLDSSESVDHLTQGQGLISAQFLADPTKSVWSLFGMAAEF